MPANSRRKVPKTSAQKNKMAGTARMGIGIPAAKFSKGSREEAAPADVQANTNKLSRLAGGSISQSVHSEKLWALRREHLQLQERCMWRALSLR